MKRVTAWRDRRRNAFRNGAQITRHASHTQELVVTRILSSAVRSNTTETLSAFSKISRVSMAYPGLETYPLTKMLIPK
jgi:hypothetical protein